MLNSFVIHDLFNGHLLGLLDFLAFLSVFLGIFIIITKNPVISILFLILLFSAIACYLVLIGVKFIGLSYILVYVGAVSILFLFILMLINIRVSELINDTNNNTPLALVAIVFFFILFITVNLDIDSNFLENKQKQELGLQEYYLNETLTQNSNTYNIKLPFVTSKLCWDGIMVDITDITSIGNIMYTSYSILLLITSVILLLAMVGAIIITIKKMERHKSESDTGNSTQPLFTPFRSYIDCFKNSFLTRPIFYLLIFCLALLCLLAIIFSINYSQYLNLYITQVIVIFFCCLFIGYFALRIFDPNTLLKVSVIFIFGFVSRFMLNSYFNIDVFKDYCSLFSLAYYFGLSSFSVFINGNLSFDKLFSYHISFNKLLSYHLTNYKEFFPKLRYFLTNWKNLSFNGKLDKAYMGSDNNKQVIKVSKDKSVIIKILNFMSTSNQNNGNSSGIGGGNPSPQNNNPAVPNPPAANPPAANPPAANPPAANPVVTNPVANNPPANNPPAANPPANNPPAANPPAANPPFIKHSWSSYVVADPFNHGARGFLDPVSGRPYVHHRPYMGNVIKALEDNAVRFANHKINPDIFSGRDRQYVIEYLQHKDPSWRTSGFYRNSKPFRDDMKKWDI